MFGHTINGESAGELTRDDLLDDITLYWLTNTAISAARFYWESHFNFTRRRRLRPGRRQRLSSRKLSGPASWTERAYHNLIYYNRVDKGGHFAAWEQPQLFLEGFARRLKTAAQIDTQEVRSQKSDR